MPRDTSEPTAIPAGFPVRPLGQSGGTFWFLTARGEVAHHGATSLGKRENLFALFVGCDDPSRWLAQIGPSKRKRDDDGVFNPAVAADWLMSACAARPLFDPDTQIRHFGTWRGDGGAPVAHVGEEIHHPGGIVDPAGVILDGAIYPARHSRTAPAPPDRRVDFDDLRAVRGEIAGMWNWQRETDADVVMGWIGQAVLGAFPDWRSHMWITGRRGSGKSTLVRILSSLLGGMSAGVKKGSSEAAVRQNTNRMALARLIDEAESEGEASQVEKIIALFRLMSDADGAQVERGTADHAGIQFRLYGAGLLASIIPGLMTPADRSRFVMLKMLKRKPDADPTAAALRRADFEGWAEDLGPAIWRRMLDLAPARWDPAFRTYSAMVQGLGGEARAGDTIGAILAGWDLMLHDGPPDDERLARAREIALPLLDDVAAAEEEGEGERCLRTVFNFMLAKDTGGTIPIAELIERMQDSPDILEPDQRLLGRLGLRLMPGNMGQRDLFVIGAQHSILDRALAGTNWRGGGHRSALLMLDGVTPAPSPTRVAGRKVRGLLVPARYLPGGDG